ESEETRSTTANTAGVALRDVKRVYVESSGNDHFSKDINARLAEEIKTSGKFESSEVKDTADAVLKISATYAGGKRGLVTVRLVNVSGRVIWKGRGRYLADVATIATMIVQDLIADARGRQ